MEYYVFKEKTAYEINMDLVKKPSLCVVCKKDDDPKETTVCNLTRLDQRNESEFKCFGYEKN